MSRRVIEKLRQGGHRAYFVGGCVRDQLLERTVKDRDIATSAHPGEVAAIFPGARTQGSRFGVCVVRDGAELVEVATFRSDGGYSDGRRPDKVTFASDARVDVSRRDFTINGILYDPASGEYLDYVGGRADLQARLVRAIGDPFQRFAEDRLRMLRAVRFAAALGFAIERGTMAAITAQSAEISTVAPERIREELGRILTEGRARRGFELLSATGLLGALLPEVAALRGVEQPPEFHPEGDVWTHTMLMLGGLRSPSEPLSWGVLLHDIGKPDTFRMADRIRFHGHVNRGVELAQEICARLRFSNADTARVLALVGNHMKFMDLRRMRPGKVRRFVEQAHFDDHLELHRLDCLASHGKLDNYRFARDRVVEFSAEDPVRPLLTGDDLKAEGYRPGPVFGKILALVEELHLDGELGDRASALKLVRERFPLSSADSPGARE